MQVDLCVNTVGDLLQFSEDKLQERYGINTGLLSALCFHGTYMPGCLPY